MKFQLKKEYDCFLWDGKNTESLLAFVRLFWFLELGKINSGFATVWSDTTPDGPCSVMLEPNSWLCVHADDETFCLSNSEFENRKV